MVDADILEVRLYKVEKSVKVNTKLLETGTLIATDDKNQLIYPEFADPSLDSSKEDVNLNRYLEQSGRYYTLERFTDNSGQNKTNGMHTRKGSLLRVCTFDDHSDGYRLKLVEAK